MAIFTNQATLSYNNTVTTSNITTGELLEVLSVTKTPLAATYTTGDTAVYVVTLANSGPAALTALPDRHRRRHTGGGRHLRPRRRQRSACL